MTLLSSGPMAMHGVASLPTRMVLVGGQFEGAQASLRRGGSGHDETGDDHSLLLPASRPPPRLVRGRGKARVMSYETGCDSGCCSSGLIARTPEETSVEVAGLASLQGSSDNGHEDRSAGSTPAQSTIPSTPPEQRAAS